MVLGLTDRFGLILETGITLMEILDRRKIAGGRRASEITAYYADIMPLLTEWTANGKNQEQQADLLNSMGKVNFNGKPYNQMMVSRVFKRFVNAA